MRALHPGTPSRRLSPPPLATPCLKHQPTTCQITRICCRSISALFTLAVHSYNADGRDGTPSLSVNLEMGSGVWFCHTGNVGGDSLTLVQHMDRVSRFVIGRDI